MGPNYHAWDVQKSAKRFFLSSQVIQRAWHPYNKRLNAGMFPMTFKPDLLLTAVHVRKFNSITVHVRVCNSERMCSYIASYYKSRSSFNCAGKVIFESQMGTTVTSHALGSSTTFIELA